MMSSLNSLSYFPKESSKLNLLDAHILRVHSAGMSKQKVTIYRYTCERCEHEGYREIP